MWSTMRCVGDDSFVEAAIIAEGKDDVALLMMAAEGFKASASEGVAWTSGHMMLRVNFSDADAHLEDMKGRLKRVATELDLPDPLNEPRSHIPPPNR